jgi:hypothetical protein
LTKRIDISIIENMKSNRYTDRNDLSLDKLFENIIKYAGSWKEQEQCLKDIVRYDNGERWHNEHKRK